jgi:hypothetical protein
MEKMNQRGLIDAIKHQAISTTYSVLKLHLFLLMCGDILERFEVTCKPLLAVSIDFGVAAEMYASMTKGRPGLVVTIFALQVFYVRK